MCIFLQEILSNLPSDECHIGIVLVGDQARGTFAKLEGNKGDFYYFFMHHKSPYDQAYA